MAQSFEYEDRVELEGGMERSCLRACISRWCRNCRFRSRCLRWWWRRAAVVVVCKSGVFPDGVLLAPDVWVAMLKGNGEWWSGRCEQLYTGQLKHVLGSIHARTVPGFWHRKSPIRFPQIWKPILFLANVIVRSFLYKSRRMIRVDTT